MAGTAQQQANSAAQRIVDVHNMAPDRTVRAAGFRLRVIQGHGRATSYAVDLLARGDRVINKRYLGTFYEDAVRDVGRQLRCHVRTVAGNVDDYRLLNCRVDAPWETFTGALGRKVRKVIDFTDTVIAGVRRISFVQCDRLDTIVTIHVAEA